jgi:hypothetical protein
MALSSQIYFSVFFHLQMMTYQNFIDFCNMTVRCCLCPIRWPYAAMFRKLTFWNQQIVESQCKCYREYSGLLKKAL